METKLFPWGAIRKQIRQQIKLTYVRLGHKRRIIMGKVKGDTEDYSSRRWSLQVAKIETITSCKMEQGKCFKWNNMRGYEKNKIKHIYCKYIKLIK